MTYSIIGSGRIGAAVARQFARAGLDILIANKRGAESLADLVRELRPHVKPAPLAEVLAADIVFLAVPYDAIGTVTSGVADWKGRIVIDATNAIDYPAFTPRDLGGRPSSDIVAAALKGARVVKAFNTLPAAILAQDPIEGPGRRVLFVSGDDAAANAEVAGLIEKLGFAPILLGKLAEGGRLQQFGAPLVAQNFIKAG
ncbi:NADPH-dependent F420 reductase [Aestuariivirga sp. YIM B02566]|uniref:NADPH-dependent F420 reductase n=2 Tax=Taklimakanibacter albus TaxID=2800327 RepID=A0ACC5R750_9HYPH|nr:NADPH-dependent F420 reductase [Aestuariivirga sp. YIM B02566]MBK1868490.1 NADPH-dependent F420 reductase [Aestuariivirga sp. YIM B02566]